jgi:hypothetical protein
VRNVLAILIIANSFSAAVETSQGFIERSFANTAEGVEQFVQWAEPLVLKEGAQIKFCTVSLDDDEGKIMDWLLENNTGPASVSTHAYREYAAKNSAPLDSAITAARACYAVFPFIKKT